MRVTAAVLLVAAVVSAESESLTLSSLKKKHHHHKHKHHKKGDKTDKKVEKTVEKKQEADKKTVEKKQEPAKPEPTPAADDASTEKQILDKMKKLETEIDKKNLLPAEVAQSTEKIDVNGPLPADFNQQFSQAVAKATGAPASQVTVVENNIISKKDGQIIVEIVFSGPAKLVHDVKAQSADYKSKLANGILQPYLVAKEGVEGVSVPPGADTGIDVDTEMPYGELEPFGREDTATELTENSIKESDQMVDQMERAEVAEEKRSVFRALTRLRGAAITSFDGVARSQTGNIDEYNKVHKWRKTHPLQHLAAEENNVSKWAFPSRSD